MIILQLQANDIILVSSTVQDVATIAISAQDDVLDHNEQLLKDQKNLYVKAVRQIEATLEIEIIMANVLCQAGIRIQEVVINNTQLFKIFIHESRLQF